LHPVILTSFLEANITTVQLFEYSN